MEQQEQTRKIDSREHTRINENGELEYINPTVEREYKKLAKAIEWIEIFKH